jgi:hypothetical protein
MQMPGDVHVLRDIDDILGKAHPKLDALFLFRAPWRSMTSSRQPTQKCVRCFCSAKPPILRSMTFSQRCPQIWGHVFREASYLGDRRPPRRNWRRKIASPNLGALFFFREASYLSGFTGTEAFRPAGGEIATLFLRGIAVG